MKETIVVDYKNDFVSEAGLGCPQAEVAIEDALAAKIAAYRALWARRRTGDFHHGHP